MPFFSSHDNIFLHKYGDFQLLMLHLSLIHGKAYFPEDVQNPFYELTDVKENDE